MSKTKHQRTVCPFSKIVGVYNTGRDSVVVVYHVTIIAIGHGLLKKCWPLVLGCVLRTVGSSTLNGLNATIMQFFKSEYKICLLSSFLP